MGKLEKYMKAADLLDNPNLTIEEKVNILHKAATRGNKGAQKGTKNEKRSMRYLNKQEYFCMDSRGSHGIFDVIASYIGKDPDKPLTIYIQSKTNGGYSRQDLVPLKMFADQVRHLPYQVVLYDWYHMERTPRVTIF